MEAGGSCEADVAIVGAGIVGIACAHRFLEEGRSVVLIDRDEPARAASFGNAGALAYSEILPLASPGILARAPRWLLDPLGPLSVPPAYAPRIAPWLYRFWRASRADRVARSTEALAALNALARTEMDRLADAAGVMGMIRQGGALDLYEGEAALRAAAPEWEARTKAGIPFEVLTQRAAIAAIQPGLSERLTHAVFCPLGQRVSDPHDFAAAIAARVAGRGGRILRGTVASLSPREEGVTIRLADGRTLHAGAAVLAAGAWSRPLAARLGDKVPLETERGYNTTLAPGAFDLRLQLTFAGHGFVATPLSGGVRVGGAVELGGLSAPPNFVRARAMLRKAAVFMPGLDTAGGREWMGFRPSLPDSLPVIGRSRASPRIVHAFGHGHLGLTQSAATARLVADLLAGRPPAIRLEPFRPSRFR
ncbi:NAD(P)/FAD-dependent oxidoreductase [Aureimonas populi]|uniref:NAD(P)/FAD-dependent oxidoreductase n=1 Tax=Aureimonas populi TaxID=1701758 RepID=A0ABW5CU74_9HYPH|nr:FAD-dependent oxidoreductase [Aureimonas populi]